MASMALSPTKSDPSMTQSVSTALHMKFNFTLRSDKDGKQRPPSRQEAGAIISAFPNCHAVGLSPPYLVLRFSQLPPKPWPLSAAGLPLYLTTDQYGDPEDFGLIGRAGTLSITPSPVLWKTPTSAMIKEIIQAYRTTYKTPISSIAWLGTRFMVTPADAKANLNELPSTIGRVLVTYRNSEPKGREAAQRAKQPLDQIRDDSNYGLTLRPGIMISCEAYEGGETLTTAGIPVRSPDGERFITVASHGFPLGLETVYHPNGNGSRIGEVKKKLWDTDISLASLNEGISYSCDTFSSNILAGSTLRGFKRLEDVLIGDNIFMDNPFSGLCEGQVTMVEWANIPCDEDASELPWVGALWMYTGNGRTEPANGSCGSVIWDEEENAIAFYRFSYDGGKSCAISVEPLIQMGMVIEPIKSSTNTL
jgi:hypothetical protein